MPSANDLRCLPMICVVPPVCSFNHSKLLQFWVHSVRILGFYDNLPVATEMSLADKMIFLRQLRRCPRRRIPPP